MSERRKRSVPSDERDFEFARELDMRKASPMSAMTRLDDSMFANAIHSGMTSKPKQEKYDPDAMPMPNKLHMSVTRRPLPSPEKKDVANDEELRNTKKLLKAAQTRIEILEREKQRVVDDIEVLKKAYIELRDKPTDLQDLLERRGFASVDELEKFILDAKESQRKAELRRERYYRRHGYA